MKNYLPMLLMLIFISGAVLSIAVAGAADNPVVNETVSKVLKTNECVNKSTNQSTSQNQTCNINKTESINQTEPTTETPVAEQKFRVGPTVVLRPVNDVITKDEDGLVELYIDNPSLNDVTLNVDARIGVPSGIHVYGQDFAQTGAAGTAYGTFSVPSGSARTISIDLKGDKVGTYTVHFSGLYWPGDNKDSYNPISLSHPFEVKEASENSEKASSSDDNGEVEAENTGGVKAEGQGSFSAPGFGILVAAIGLLGVYAVKKK
ncbi:PGF-CTERM sorting domain-containing protein [Methanosarcina barkeri]|uniref:PGF-CTERM archaeal protein-sorting signal domain-containing protein n=1 Tax=Methanosarcina barkeri (strain Fusaro / DSM 804) TaxID=269797 RepID=Q465B9_METBF|nr:PGF-CTERM sorting domain-containing protein [Methanosarcina barkeri]